MTRLTSPLLGIGDPVRVKKFELNGTFVREIEIPATVVGLDRMAKAVGVAYADGTREMVQVQHMDLLGAQL